ncbi:hypothetical protein A7979_09930 [Rothia nasimurium]|uniref:Uncharacterized protein n=1 Tax=Rothia nasimurium TaxID=85336 RepID=A0A1Y1RRM3_9MICC|nr:ATP-dependent endonuclease [Rothia nasimurium]ORC24313.1 hypothetical protein A7979_09930 [Rothia nasimurium]
MKISSVQIKNFRTIQEANINFDSITTFIGPNGVGKSTVLRALDWFFNGDIKTGELADEDVFSGTPEEDISVAVTFSDLTVSDREALGKYAPTGSASVTIWKIREFSTGNEYLSANYLAYPGFSELRQAENANEVKNIYSSLRSGGNPLNLPEANTKKAIEEAIVTWESENIDKLAEVRENTPTQLFGFNGKSILGGIFDYVFIDANLRASDESEDSKGSILSRILDFYIDRKQSAAKIQNITSQTIQSHQDEIFSIYSENLEKINSNINTSIESYSSGRKVRVIPTPLEMKTNGASFTINILDGETVTSVEKQGHGFQRTLLISALQSLANIAANQSERVIFLAIEEPELYQHPIQARNFAKVLQDLASDSSKGVQIAYATHSPFFLDDKKFEQVRRISRVNTNAGSVASIGAARKERIIEKLDCVVSENTINSQLGKIITGQIAEALFSNAVLIVEGSTEAGIFYGVGDRDRVGYLESLGISVIPAGSKMNVPLLHAILSEFGVPTYCLFDADSGCEERARSAGKSSRDVRNDVANQVSQNKKILTYFDKELVDFPPQGIYDSFAVFKDHLETFLKEEWLGWEEKCLLVEREMAINIAKNNEAYRIIALDATTEVPDFIQEVFNKVVSLVEN